MQVNRSKIVISNNSQKEEIGRGGGGPGISLFDWSENFQGILGTYLEITCSAGRQYLHGKPLGPTLM